jgi:hypothetical protein
MPDANALYPPTSTSTVTSDRAVVEINMAPAHDLATFARWAEDIYAAEAGALSIEHRKNERVICFAVKRSRMAA